jgi:ABC-2 type transport system ATP-binding protein
MIKLDRVTKRYGSKTAVHEITLDIAPGELFAFLGPNGAGKTTTIKMMCGLLFPTSGHVLIGGHDLRRDGDRARQLLSYVPDQPFLYEKLTGREFLQFIADMYGLAAEQARRRINEVIDLFELHEFVDDLTERYSHGMRQRTVFASALVHEPKVLIVDEPTVGLDPHSVRRLKDLLRRQADQGTTVFLSSHSLDVVEELADRIAIIEHGRLIACGPLAALRAQASSDGSLEDVFLTLTSQATEGLYAPGASSLGIFSPGAHAPCGHGGDDPLRHVWSKGPDETQSVPAEGHQEGRHPQKQERTDELS